jgi:hypothetical protein
MIDRDALLREMEESGNGSIVLASVAADIAVRHIAAARAEAFHAGFEAGHDAATDAVVSWTRRLCQRGV